MKKNLLSFFIIFTFSLYAMFLRKQRTNENLMAPLSPSVGISSPTPTISAPGTKTPSARGPEPTVRGVYKDGHYTGSSKDAYYGNVQVEAIIQGGKITDVVFLDYPNDRSTSREINRQAMPLLKQETILAQSSNVDIISGATDTSMAFKLSLASALAQGKN